MVLRLFICSVEVEIDTESNFFPLWFGHGGEGETVPFPSEQAPMRAFMRTIDRGSPVAAGTLKSKPFDEDVLHSLESMTGNDTGAILDESTIAIVAIISISKIEHCHYSAQGKIFQRRSHQVRVRRSVSFVSQMLSLDWASSACALK